MTSVDPQHTGPAPTFLEDFRHMSSFGATDGGGVHREAATEADHATREWFAGWLESQGFTIGADRIGNLFGTYELVPGAPYLLMGSHLDSQPMAGRYDGAYGVLAAAHAALRLRDEAEAGRIEPILNLCVVDWFNEEGSRFGPSMMGSGVYAGVLDEQAALSTTDRAGVTVAEALSSGPEMPAAQLPTPAAYAEIHVEQGRELEDAGTPVGLVDRTWGARKFRITVRGDQSHTGAALMADRRDALYGASLVIVAVRELCHQFGDDELRTAVSTLELEPNSPVTIAREVTFQADLRSPDESVLDTAAQMLLERLAEAEQAASVTITHELTHSWGQLAYSTDGVALARKAAESLELPHMEVMTVAGHDSTTMKDLVPTVMLFVPSVDGLSHNEAEYTRDEDLVRGVDLLTEVGRRILDGDLTGPVD
ncbi:M20 family metallo-hydrolase [Nesterenkonia aerolata]|uniref:M20 family metallo-hydrolase n=1 Tax=Nesterenkonia aerolata TaxID=3074079 RepID=A0ABU2DRZ6_9MICC|nr:M20 family metallo-hydrolase [Nesterenkonia sp. LY-0111]MDR8019292.1 M20 family metallo-hydrolase [Nesterenkonia sp. LY-0111]